MSNRVFPYFVALLVLLGILLGWFLAGRESFSMAAILNVVGILYSIVAVLVLYETIAYDKRLKTLIVSHVAPTLLWAQTVIPLGVTISWIFTFSLPHGSEVSGAGFSFLVYSILPLGFLDAAVTFPRYEKLMSVNGRHRRFGLYLLLSGLGMQLVASLYAL